MFGIILKSYVSSILWYIFNEDSKMQTRKILLWVHVLFVYWKTQSFNGKYNILSFEKCVEHLQQLMILDKFVPFCRPRSGTVII